MVPALQSWWIHVHVISASVAYSAGTIGAVTSLLYLVAAKDKLSLRGLGAGTLAVSAFLIFILGRGLELFTTGQYRIKLLREMGDEMIPVGRMVQDKFASYYLASPYVGPLLIATFIACIVGAVVLWKSKAESDVPQGQSFWAWAVPFGLMSATIGLMIFNNLSSTNIHGLMMWVPADAPGPWRFAMESNQWDMSLFGLCGGRKPLSLCACWHQPPPEVCCPATKN